MRALEKAAVAAGGGRNHRMGLHDAVLIKENHIALAGGLAEAAARPRGRAEREIEVECRSAEEIQEALGTGADHLLLTTWILRNCGPRSLPATRTPRHGPGDPRGLGRDHLDNVAEVAATGVDFVSVGALTHSAPALDLSMLLQPADR